MTQGRCLTNTYNHTVKKGPLLYLDGQKLVNALSPLETGQDCIGWTAQLYGPLTTKLRRRASNSRNVFAQMTRFSGIECVRIVHYTWRTGCTILLFYFLINPPWNVLIDLGYRQLIIILPVVWACSVNQASGICFVLHLSDLVHLFSVQRPRIVM